MPEVLDCQITPHDWLLGERRGKERPSHDHGQLPLRPTSRADRVQEKDGNSPTNIVTPSRLQPELRPFFSIVVPLISQHSPPHPFLRRSLSLQSPMPLALSRNLLLSFLRVT